MPKLYNAIAIFDVYVVAESSEAARAALLTMIRTQPPIDPSEVVGVEANREQAIRNVWCEQTPFVAADISDDDFKKIDGKTTIEMFEHLYTKQPKDKP